MSAFANGHWHNSNGQGLPFRPPTVDEALPYSPFTSIVPFSPDVIPFPSAEPPTPPTTLTPEQRTGAKKAVGILNDEIRGPPSTAQHLESTLRELRGLLGNPDDMTNFYFKPATQLATPPPDSPKPQANGSPATRAPTLSPFASMLLKQTAVPYLPAGTQSPRRPRVKQEAPRPTVTQPAAHTPTQPSATSRNHTSHLQNGAIHYSPAATPSGSRSQPRSGPAVVIGPSGPTAPREEYLRFDTIRFDDSATQQNQEGGKEAVGISAMRPHEREIAERKINELENLVQALSEEKEDPDETDSFFKISSLESEVVAMKAEAVDRLYDRLMAVCGTGAFSSVSVDTVLRIQSLCEPSISSIEPFAEPDSWADDLRTVESGLKASKLVLTAMLDGRDDRRISREDLVVAVIQAVKHVLDSCIIPVLVARRNDDMDLYKQASHHKEKLASVLRLCGGVLRRLGTLIGKISLTDSALNSVEFLALALLVQQNSDHDKDSFFGVQRFESLRQAAMEVLTQIFASHPDHQIYILDEILNNLEKLPDKGANARQFKSARDPPIMSVSALFMRFIQVAATNRDVHHTKATTQAEDADASQDEDSEYGSERSTRKKAKDKSTTKSTAKSVAQSLMEGATVIAQRIALTLVSRALNVSKGGDKPFRNLLDMFVEDFCSVLGSPEWPAAVIILQQLVHRMFHILSTQQSNRDMALAVMATMGCGTIDFRVRLKRLKRDLDTSQSELSAKLGRLVDDALGNNIDNKDIFGLNGPYRAVIESLPDYLKVQANQDDPHLLSVRGCYVTSWMDSVSQTLKSSSKEGPYDQSLSDIQNRVDAMVLDSKWLSREYKFRNVSELQSQLAAGIITLQHQYCRFLPVIVNKMVQNTQDSAATIKSRATKSIESFLNKDPQIISDQTVMIIVHLFKDNSPLVRADAVSLISKCLEGNPDLERICLHPLIHLTIDPSNGPKKKAINLLRKLYSSTTSKDHRLMIVTSLLPPSQDHEKPIAELARQALEDIWLKPLDPSTRGDGNQLKLLRVERATLLVETVCCIQGQESHLEAFEKFFAGTLVSKANSQPTHFRICKDLVADMVEGVISPESMAVGISQDRVLLALSIFAKISPKLFTLDQVQLLKIYVKDLGTLDDLPSFRPTVVIFRFVFPELRSLQPDFAEEVRGSLNRTVPKLANWASQGRSDCKLILLDVVHCLWMISPLANQGVDRLIVMVSDILSQLQPIAMSMKEKVPPSRIRSYLILVGTFGKVCNFDGHLDTLRMRVTLKAQQQVDKQMATAEQMKSLLEWKGSSGSVLLLQKVLPFTERVWDMGIREAALCSMGEICQGSPRLFMRKEVEDIFKVVFKNENNIQLKRVVLTLFNDFFLRAERPSENGASEAIGVNTVGSAGRLGITFVAGEGQVTTNYLARQFLPDVVDIALKTDNDLALLATSIITSISRQGLVHPKECGPALIALGTSPNVQIAQSASTEHKKIHDAHESMFEKEYMSAVKMASAYQQEVCKDAHGMIGAAYKPKMLELFNVLKGGNRKTLKKFIDNLCKQMDFELPKLKSPEASSGALLFVRFCLENLALFDVPKLEDVAILLNALENIVLKHTGPSVGVAIETEMPKQASALEFQPQQPPPETGIDGIEALPTAWPTTQDHGFKEAISEARLLQITRACMILQMMWETRSFVRRAYNLHNLVGRVQHKDYQKPASRNNLVSGRELWERFELIFESTNSRDTMMKRCYEFAELLEVDKDAKIGDEDEEDDPLDYVTPDEGDDNRPAVPTSGRGRKRKLSAGLSNTPKKSRGRPPGAKNKKRNSRTPELDGLWD